MKTAALLLAAWVSTTAWAQSTVVNGYVTDGSSGEKLVHAYVYDRVSGNGTRTNDYGFYSLNLTGDSARIYVSYPGYVAVESRLTLNHPSLEVNYPLTPDKLLDEVTVVADRPDEEPIHEEAQMSTIRLDMKQVKNLPVLLGETDLLKTIQLLPGVQSGTEGSSGFYVRGGGPDQNLILIDGVPVYNVSHLFGFFSIFNGDAIKSVELVKGGFPAEYGGRLSSVLDIRMREGHMSEFHGEGSIGLISSKLTLEGPIWREHTSFLVSARRTYIDFIAKPLIESNLDGGSAGYYFYDVNAKLNHRFNDDHHLYLSIYNGRDRASSDDEYTSTDSGFTSTDRFGTGLEWGNTIGSLRWNYRIRPNLFLNTTATYTKYNFNVGIEEETTVSGGGLEYSELFAAEYLSEIEDVGLRTEFDYYPIPNHEVKFGVNYTHHTFRPGVNSIQLSETGSNYDTTYGSSTQRASEIQAYIRDDFEVGDRWRFNLGLHAVGFAVGESFYTSLQPRAGARFLLDETSSLKASWANMTQYLHLLTNQTVGLPTDLWVPATDEVAPQRSWQAALGYAKTLPWNLQLSAEVYYKEMENLIEYKEGAGFFLGSSDWQNKVTVGRGTSYGFELLLEKKVGRLTGWIGYTLSRSTRQFDDVNFGNPYPYTYDRRHDVSVTATYQLSDRWTAGVVWVYGTGNAVTLPTSVFVDPNTGQRIEHFNQRNNYRAPAYHRLDLAFTYTKPTSWGESSWQFGVYNVYSRNNPFYLYFAQGIGGNELRQVSLFPILPSISWSFKF